VREYDIIGGVFKPQLTRRENIHLKGAFIGMKKIEINRKFDDIIEFAEAFLQLLELKDDNVLD
jgi:ABC-type polysaccharide/polyol phosphate transport system ATPase subunit